MGSKRKASDVDVDLPDSTNQPFLKRTSTISEQNGQHPSTGGILFADGTSQIQLHDQQQQQQQQQHHRTDSFLQSLTPSDPALPLTKPVPRPTNGVEGSSNGFVPPSLMNTLSPPSTPHISSPFQHKLTAFCSAYGGVFGPAYVAPLKDAHWQVASSTSAAAILAAGQRFVRTLGEYVAELQEATVQQMRWRARVVGSIGVGSEAVAAVDATLAQLDAHIIGIGGEAEGLVQELAALEHRFRSGEGGALS